MYNGGGTGRVRHPGCTRQERGPPLGMSLMRDVNGGGWGETLSGLSVPPGLIQWALFAGSAVSDRIQ